MVVAGFEVAGLGLRAVDRRRDRSGLLRLQAISWSLLYPTKCWPEKSVSSGPISGSLSIGSTLHVPSIEATPEFVASM
jgi:hypothetical protein